jgi:hypothetical protein
VRVEGGIWPPGDGEPGRDWRYEPHCELVLQLMPGEDVIDVFQVTPDGNRALCAVPLEGVALLMIRERLSSG